MLSTHISKHIFPSPCPLLFHCVNCTQCFHVSLLSPMSFLVSPCSLRNLFVILLLSVGYSSLAWIYSIYFYHLPTYQLHLRILRALVLYPYLSFSYLSWNIYLNYLSFRHLTMNKTNISKIDTVIYFMQRFTFWSFTQKVTK